MQCTPSTPKSMAISHRFVQCHRWNMRQWKKGHRIDCARLDPNVFIVVDPSGHSGKSLESIYLRSSIRAPTASRIGMNTILSPSYLRRSKAQHSAPPPPEAPPQDLRLHPQVSLPYSYIHFSEVPNYFHPISTYFKMQFKPSVFLVLCVAFMNVGPMTAREGSSDAGPGAKPASTTPSMSPTRAFLLSKAYPDHDWHSQ